MKQYHDNQRIRMTSIMSNGWRNTFALPINSTNQSIQTKRRHLIRLVEHGITKLPLYVNPVCQPKTWGEGNGLDAQELKRKLIM